MKNLRPFLPLCAALLFSLAIPAYSQTRAEQLGDAYQNGYTHGQADADRGVARSDQPGDQWATRDAQRAYREGYDAGFRSVPARSAVGVPPATTPSGAMASNIAHPVGSEAMRFGYDDGIAAGRKDRDNGHNFKPTDGDMYKHGDHGWTSDFGDKDHYKQLYRQAYTQGYQDGFGANVPQ